MVETVESKMSFEVPLCERDTSRAVRGRIGTMRMADKETILRDAATNKEVRTSGNEMMESRNDETC